MDYDSGQDIADKYHEFTDRVLKVAYSVHTYLGPGLLESVYEECLADELKHAGFKVESQIPIPVRYKGRLINKAFTIDLLVDNVLIIELKSVEKLLPVHLNQVKTYLKLSNLEIGLLINFNEAHLRDGIKRVTNRVKMLSDF